MFKKPVFDNGRSLQLRRTLLGTNLRVSLRYQTWASPSRWSDPKKVFGIEARLSSTTSGADLSMCNNIRENEVATDITLIIHPHFTVPIVVTVNSIQCCVCAHGKSSSDAPHTPLNFASETRALISKSTAGALSVTKSDNAVPPKYACPACVAFLISAYFCIVFADCFLHPQQTRLNWLLNCQRYLN